MPSKKEYTIKGATKVLEPLSHKPPEYFENQAIYEAMERIPVGVSMELVTAVLRQQVKGASIDSSAVLRVRNEYFPAVLAVLRDNPRDTTAAFLLGGLPVDVEAGAAQYPELLRACELLAFLGLPRYAKSRSTVLEALAKDERVLAAARAQLAVIEPDTVNGSLMLLAYEGSASSVAAITPVVERLLEDRRNLDWLREDLAVLMTAPTISAMKQRIVGKAEARNAASRGLLAGNSLGLAGKEWFRFKVELYAAGDWPKLRLWVDSTKDPWYDATWNWNELVRFPEVEPDTTPRAELEGVMASVMREATWVRYQFSSPHTGPFKKTLAAWVAARLEGVRLTTP